MEGWRRKHSLKDHRLPIVFWVWELVSAYEVTFAFNRIYLRVYLRRLSEI